MAAAASPAVSVPLKAFGAISAHRATIGCTSWRRRFATRRFFGSVEIPRFRTNPASNHAMNEESIIYEITRAVYRRLGDGANPSLVEDIVTDVYRVVGPALAPAAAPPAEPSPAPQSRAVISIFGNDRVGIVARVAHILADANCNLIDINQTLLRGKFVMSLIADVSHSKLSLAALKERLAEEGERLGLKIYIQREDLFHAMHRI
jgi:ACT domain-containing protein